MTARLDQKIAEAYAIVDEAIATHLDGHELVGKVVLFSGGNDSTTLAHLFRDRVTHAAHANTTIGVERTRQFVRDCCEQWGIPLLERSGPQTYRDLVLEAGGFPGPAMHFKMYQRLKERALREVRRELVANGRKQRVLFIAGRRRSESERRSGITLHERIDSVIWASPFADWTKDDLDEYRSTFGVVRNDTADRLGMSGECLCGAFAEPGEYDRIAEVDADAAQLIWDIEQQLHAQHGTRRRDEVAEVLRVLHDAREARLGGEHVKAVRLLQEAGDLRSWVRPEAPPARCQWGWGAYRADPDGQPPKTGPLCSSCDARFAIRRDEVPAPEVLAVRERIAARRLARQGVVA